MALTIIECLGPWIDIDQFLASGCVFHHMDPIVEDPTRESNLGSVPSPASVIGTPVLGIDTSLDGSRPASRAAVELTRFNAQVIVGTDSPADGAVVARASVVGEDARTLKSQGVQAVRLVATVFATE